MTFRRDTYKCRCIYKYILMDKTMVMIHILVLENRQMQLKQHI